MPCEIIFIVVIKYPKLVQRTLNMVLYISITLWTLPSVVIVQPHRRNKTGETKNGQKDDDIPFNKNEANKSIIASKKIEQIIGNKMDQILSTQK